MHIQLERVTSESFLVDEGDLLQVSLDETPETLVGDEKEVDLAFSEIIDRLDSLTSTELKEQLDNTPKAKGPDPSDANWRESR